MVGKKVTELTRISGGDNAGLGEVAVEVMATGLLKVGVHSE